MLILMLSLKSFIFGKKAVPYIDIISEVTREGLNKSYIPKFLYKPPYGYPRYANLEYVRYLAKMPYVEMCLDTIIKEVSAIEWDIIPNPSIPEHIAEKLFYDEEGNFKNEIEAEINHQKNFLKNPNTNKESFEDVFVKMAYRDVLELNSGIINKVFNLKGEMVEIVARAGETFTKNPDIHGMFTNREDILIPQKIVENVGEVVNPFTHIHSGLARESAAYFQYGWICGPMPIPYGKREIIWMQDMIRSNDIYGYSKIQILANALQMLVYHIESDLEYYNNNNVPKGIIGIDASDSDEIKSFRQQWYDQMRTKDEFGNWKKMQHKVPIVNYIPKFERIEFSSEELQLIEKQKWYSKMVWSIFGVNPTELGYTEDAKGISNQIVQSKTFKKKAINPALRMIENCVNTEVLTEFNYIVEIPIGGKNLPTPKYIFKYQTFDIDEEKSKAELHKIWLETGRKTINEIRVDEGDKPVEWGDEDPRITHSGNNFYMGNNNPNQEEKELNQYTEEPSEPLSEPESSKRNETRVNNQKGLKKKDYKGEEELTQELLNYLDSKKKEIYKYMELEVGDNVLKQIKSDLEEFSEKDLDLIEIKSVDRLISALKDILTIEGIKESVFKSIRKEFLEGAVDAEEDINKLKPYNYVPDRDAIDYIGKYTFENVKGMSEDIANNLRVQLQMGFMNGEGLPKLKSRVKEVFETSNHRAKTIARTESARASHFGKLSAWKESGIKSKKWILMTDDNRTSDISRALNKKYGSEEKAIPIEENFKCVVKVGKKTLTIDQPVGPFHPNERCDIIITPVFD